MLATLVNEPFDDKEWVFETKWDGIRLITEKHGDTVRLWSRNGINVSKRYAVLLPALQKVEGSCVTIVLSSNWRASERCSYMRRVAGSRIALCPLTNCFAQISFTA